MKSATERNQLVRQQVEKAASQFLLVTQPEDFMFYFELQNQAKIKGQDTTEEIVNAGVKNHVQKLTQKVDQYEAMTQNVRSNVQQGCEKI